MALRRIVLACVVAAAQAVPAAASDAIEGWLFVGRRSDGEWRPAAAALAAPAYPLGPGSRLVVSRDALVYGSVDCRVTPAAEFRAGGGEPQTAWVVGGTEALEVVAPVRECGSAGRGATVWANVRIPPERYSVR